MKNKSLTLFSKHFIIGKSEIIYHIFQSLHISLSPFLIKISKLLCGNPAWYSLSFSVCLQASSLFSSVSILITFRYVFIFPNILFFVCLHNICSWFSPRFLDHLLKESFCFPKLVFPKKIEQIFQFSWIIKFRLLQQWFCGAT